MSNDAPTIMVPNEPQATVHISPVRLKFDEHDHPSISLPPPTPVNRGHQRSKTSFEFSGVPARSNSVSPTRSSTFLPFRKTSRPASPERTGSASTHSVHTSSEPSIKHRSGTVSKLSAWFEGSSDPVNISFVPSPKKEVVDPFYKIESGSGSNMNTEDKFTARPSKRHTVSPSTANSSVFSFFKRSTTQAQTKADPDDILHLDIEETLLPNGPVEVFSQDNFKALQHNAECLIRKVQLSYAENLGALRQMTSEKSVQEDELEACRTKNEHLKMQLLVMAEKAADHEKTITDLHEQINKHQQGIRMITEDEPNTPLRNYRRSRLSDCSSSGASMVDSDISSAVSVFSDAESIHTVATSVAASPVMKHARLHNPILTPNPAANPQTTQVLVADCSNCHGVRASEAWDVIGVMKAESMGLKQRVIELENAQDAALDFLTALNL